MACRVLCNKGCIFILATAKHGFQSDGVELNPWLVWWSRLAALKEGVGAKTRFYRKDLWKFNLKPYDYVVIFGVEQMVSKMQWHCVKK